MFLPCVLAMIQWCYHGYNIPVIPAPCVLLAAYQPEYPVSVMTDEVFYDRISSGFVHGGHGVTHWIQVFVNIFIHFSNKSLCGLLTQPKEVMFDCVVLFVCLSTQKILDVRNTRHQKYIRRQNLTSVDVRF